MMNMYVKIGIMCRKFLGEKKIHMTMCESSYVKIHYMKNHVTNESCVNYHLRNNHVKIKMHTIHVKNPFFTYTAFTAPLRVMRKLELMPMTLG